MGHMAEAADQLKAVVALQPKDQLSAQLLQQIQQSQQSQNGAPGDSGCPGGERAGRVPRDAPAPAESAPSPAAPTGSIASSPAPTGKEGNLQGTWVAQPSKDTTITVTFQDQGNFTWKVAHQGQDHQFQGKSSFVNGILTLARTRIMPWSATLTGRTLTTSSSRSWAEGRAIRD